MKGTDIAWTDLEATENVIDMSTQGGSEPVFFFVTNRSGHSEQGDWRTEFKRAVCLPVRTRQIDVVFVVAVAKYLELPIHRMRPKLSKSCCQICLDQLNNILDDSRRFWQRHILDTR